ncbi:MAG: hypothetical protein EWV49_12220 [Microcystis aeruginosa Ma_QC_Ch_20071001_S25]|uniref:Uncharacterized protein n=1 Tax=Microcystis aeruginosa Ma_QC_Ch_20071001_S25D TaxID=2486250 RepID=A0A552FX45_MICAE|nr:MAG: hypothetical protein EWV49_12220 [Microcystis aeruginosa Ma_QC_Ch_20071001_S25]TRU51276.1 MAG: hypothetical protein EWV57_07755 [Microcystis aeruginosa Ma_QC_Ch_20071001_S25D]TRU59681.1 MAG: hypothetical protein EWV90_16590 [Microcystis aeruginosa Ma_QC_Ch_20071001_M135]
MTNAFISKTIIVYRPQITYFVLTYTAQIVKILVVLRCFILVGVSSRRAHGRVFTPTFEIKTPNKSS